MTKVRVIVGSVWLVLVLFGFVVWAASAAFPLASPHYGDATTVSEYTSSGGDRGDGVTEPTLDLYGNEIHRAIGDYRVDPQGELYERHSPDTAVLKPKPPGA